jgi:uncharacterized peroxidase-related enzyme
VLLLVYPDASIANQIVDDAQSAPIPDLHKAMYAWVEKFVRGSWDMNASDIQVLRDAGATDKQIASWAHSASMQTWWVMMGDGGGISLDYGMEVGPVVGNTRPFYEKAEPGLLAAAPDGGAPAQTSDGDAWIETDESSETYKRVARAAQDRYGFVPNVLKATSCAPETLPRHQHAFEILERPQSKSLSPRLHALTRAITSKMNRSSYFDATIKPLVEMTTQGANDYEKISGPWDPEQWDETDRVVLEFAIKAARNAYKIVDSDAQGFREVGLDDEAYVDVLNTVAIQTSIERFANSLGIAADEGVMLKDAPVPPG